MEKIDRLPWGATELRKPRFSPKQNIFLNRAEGKKNLHACTPMGQNAGDQILEVGTVLTSTP